jgi:Velvet factor
MSNSLAGTSVSSLYRLKDQDNTGTSIFCYNTKRLDGGFFVFGDLSVRMEGQFRLRFYLFEVRGYFNALDQN